MTTPDDNASSMTCDYLVVGAGATGLAFCDTLLLHHHQSSSNAPPSVILVDQHATPGGQWNDSYSFVRLHQPSQCYGVESMKLEPDHADAHRATRLEILDYYAKVVRKLEEQYDFQFLGETWFDLGQVHGNDGPYQLKRTNSTISVSVQHKVVDARYLEPDLPIAVGPKFQFDPHQITCKAVNELSSLQNDKTTTFQHFCVIGGGKTGMDAVTYLQTQLKIEPDDIMWIVPNQAWITARENIGSCMEFLHTCTQLAKQEQQTMEQATLEQLVTAPDFFQKGFLEWERRGHVYRMKYNHQNDALPTKFKDATLCQEEMALLQKVQNVVSGRGRIREIDGQGALHFVDGTELPLPWPAHETLFVHASAGAFNYTKHPGQSPPVFSDSIITIQDVYGTPGFCFVGSIFAKLETLGLTNENKNRMCTAPRADPTQARLPLGPSGGDIGVISPDHGLVQRVSNLRQWLAIPELQQWLVGHRLFNLGHLTAQEMQDMVQQIWAVLTEAKLVEST